MSHKKLQFPIRKIAADIRAHVADVRNLHTTQELRAMSPEDRYVDIRLTVWPNGEFVVHSGLVDYDLIASHAAHSVSLTGTFDSFAVARGLVNQAADMCAEDPDFAGVDIMYAEVRRAAQYRKFLATCDTVANPVPPAYIVYDPSVHSAHSTHVWNQATQTFIKLHHADVSEPVAHEPGCGFHGEDV